MEEILAAWLKTLDAVKTAEVLDSAETYNSKSWVVRYDGKNYKIGIEVEERGVYQDEETEEVSVAVDCVDLSRKTRITDMLRTLPRDEVDEILQALKQTWRH